MGHRDDQVRLIDGFFDQVMGLKPVAVEDDRVAEIFRQELAAGRVTLDQTA